MVVCDGMGGHLRGDVAAQYVIEHIGRAFRASAAPKLKDPADFLMKSILGAHKGLNDFAATYKLPETPRTTVVAAIVQDGKASWAHVGDSRLYLIRGDSVVARTMDHSHVQALVDRGIITADEACVHPDRNKIYNCIGQNTVPRIDVQKGIPLKKGDRLVLCSDGLWGPLNDETMTRVMHRAPIHVALPMLMDFAEAWAGREADNLSVVSMAWEGEPEAGQDDGPIRPIQSDRKPIDDADIELAMETISTVISAGSPSASAP
jgi:serine/threonine protein phosphatase PrpC